MSRRFSTRAVITSTAAILILAAGCADVGPVAPAAESVSMALVGGQTGKARIAVASQKYAAGSHFAVIDAEGGTLDFGIGSLNFPRGALDSPVRITASVDGSAIAVDFGPHGLVFPDAAQPVLTFRYGTVDLDPAKMRIMYVDDGGNVLEVFETIVDSTPGTASAAIPHFSRMVLAVG